MATTSADRPLPWRKVTLRCLAATYPVQHDPVLFVDGHKSGFKKASSKRLRSDLLSPKNKQEVQEAYRERPGLCNKQISYAIHLSHSIQ